MNDSIDNNENRSKTAVALGFEAGDDTPRILATGKGFIANKIISAAKEENIPVHKDPKLAKALSGLDIGEYIPPELYEVVVEVLKYVDRIDSVRAKLDRLG